MATALLSRTKKFRKYRLLWIQEDVQSMLVLYALRAIAEQDIDTSNPKSVINYLVNATQNRLRNLAAYMERRKDFNVTFDVDIETGLIVSDFNGERRTRIPNAKTVTTVYNNDKQRS